MAFQDGPGCEISARAELLPNEKNSRQQGAICPGLVHQLGRVRTAAAIKVEVNFHFHLSQITPIANICDMGTERRKRWRSQCWVCGKRIESVRCTAFLCGPRCRQRWNRMRHGKHFEEIAGEFSPFFRARPEFIR